jgi:dTDP-4-dehydrorhamnose 3,5-epimerase
MEFRSFAIQGPVEIVPTRLGDERGYFAEIFREDRFSEAAGRVHFAGKPVAEREGGHDRGLHFQTHPMGQGKLVRCAQVRSLMWRWIFAMIPTFGQWIGVELTPEACNQLWVPVGFAHGFCTLKPDSIVAYKVTNYYSPENDKGTLWNDPAIGIDWPSVADGTTLSAKDKVQPRLADLPPYFGMKD